MHLLKTHAALIFGLINGLRGFWFRQASIITTITIIYYYYCSTVIVKLEGSVDLKRSSKNHQCQ